MTRGPVADCLLVVTDALDALPGVAVAAPGAMYAAGGRFGRRPLVFFDIKN